MTTIQSTKKLLMNLCISLIIHHLVYISYFTTTLTWFQSIVLILQFLTNVTLSPSYTYKVWNYSKSNFKNIQKAIFDFDWMKTFENISANSKKHYWTFCKITFPKKLKCDHRPPPWMLKDTKKALKERTRIITISEPILLIYYPILGIVLQIVPLLFEERFYKKPKNII